MSTPDVGYQKRWRAANRDKINATAKRWRDKNRIRVRELTRVRMKQWYKQLKQEMVAAYGGKCVCCEDTTVQFLTFHHSNGDGTCPHQEVPRV